MAYRLDEDLEFLQYLDDKSLDLLVEVLIKNKDGELRLTENITCDVLYKTYSPQHSKYWELIGEEIQTFGGNTLVNVVRRKGISYKEILCNVCDKMKVNYNKNSNVSTIEENLFMKILKDSMKDMTEEELKEIVKELNLKTQSFSKETVMAALQIAIKQGGFKSYQIAVIVANAVWKTLFGKGLTIVANSTLTKTISIFSGPIGWVITGVLTAIDIAGPAYRVTIPSVIQVAFLRQKYINENLIEEELNNE
jgi:uncharacterized protein YaaW (UPF0174 family)